MAHYAKIVNDTVVEVTVADQDFINTLDGEWIQTSYNTRNGVHYDQNGNPSQDQSKALRGNYAGIGFVYDREHDVFYKAKPYASWSLNTTTWEWEAPVPRPTEDKVFKWNEENNNWVEY